MRGAIAATVAAAILLAGGDGVRAETCPAPTGAAASLQTIDPSVRLDWIDARLSRTARRAQVWTWGWEIALGGGTVGNLAPLPWVGHDLRVDFVTGAVTTVIGIVPLVALPLSVIDDAHELRAGIATARANATGATSASSCGLLADAERRLARDADSEGLGQGWLAHVANVVLNGGVGAFLWLGYGHRVSGVLNFVGGAAVGEAIIFTQPTETIDDLRHYRAGVLAPPPPVATTWTLLPDVGTRQAGLRLVLNR